MESSVISGAESANELLNALAEQLEALGAKHEIVVIGGSALLALGLVDRATRDVDLVALREGDSLLTVSAIPPTLADARDIVARDFAIPSNWLNAGPAALLDFGLPAGFIERAEERVYGAALTVTFASRYDQIHFKLYAMVDQGPGKHERDLRALTPTEAELLAAARWSRTHDPSEGYREMLINALRYMGVAHADLGA